MTTGTEGRTWSWLRGLGMIEWAGDERPYAALIEALTRDRLETSLVEREMDAGARVNMAAVEEQAEVSAEVELERARGELTTFRAALEDLHARGGTATDAEVPFDAANPVEDAQADALIQYLVRPGYADVRTEEPEPEHYVYCIRADWPRLRALAEELGHPLPL